MLEPQGNKLTATHGGADVASEHALMCAITCQLEFVSRVCFRRHVCGLSSVFRLVQQTNSLAKSRNEAVTHVFQEIRFFDLVWQSPVCFVTNKDRVTRVFKCRTTTWGPKSKTHKDALKDIFERVSAVPTRNIVGFVIVSHWQGGGRGKIASMSSRISTAATLDVLVPS